MGKLRIRLTNDNVYTSYMGGTPNVSPMSNAWLSILNCLILGGDVIEVSDERIKSSLPISDLNFSYDTDTAKRTRTHDQEINPLDNFDVLIEWLENNPAELERLTNLINGRE